MEIKKNNFKKTIEKVCFLLNRYTIQKTLVEIQLSTTTKSLVNAPDLKKK